MTLTVHLLTKQLNFLTQAGVLFAQLLVFFKKLLFAQSLHCLAKGSKIHA